MPFGADDALLLLGGLLSGGLEQSNQNQSRALSKEQFERTQREKEAQAAVGAEQRLSRAPLADQAQALIKARTLAPPTAFQPRDFTSAAPITQSLTAPATGGPSRTLNAGAQAATDYQPGAGGVQTDVLKAYLQKMLGSSQLDKPETPFTPPPPKDSLTLAREHAAARQAAVGPMPWRR
jgi:hypothetical protein